jgi:hypothetical protein
LSRNIFYVENLQKTHLFYMNIEDRYYTLDLYRVGINLTPLHYDFLRELANTKFNRNITETIFYLVSKYMVYLYHVRITPTKGTETATYQPKTKEYKRYSLRLNPALWSKLFDCRRFIGYSISAMLRIILDWEMQEQGREIIPMVEKPDLPFDDDLDVSSQWIENYVYTKTADYHTRRIFSFFWDQFY